MTREHPLVLVFITFWGLLVSITIELSGLYTVFGWADTLAHFAAGLGLVGVYRLVRPHTHWSDTLAGIVVVAIVWELLEIVLPGFSGLLTLGVVDTVVDIIVTVTGGIISHAMRADA